MKKTSISRLSGSAAAAMILSTGCHMETAMADGGAQAAKDLANPVAAVYTVPVKLNTGQEIGPTDDGNRYFIEAQPVIPFSLNEDWNLISRTLLYYIHQDDVLPGSGSQQGLGDTVQSLFFSPKKPTEDGWIWGAGPVFLLPTASDDLLGKEKWGAGPTAVGLKQEGPYTYGLLVNHIWAPVGDDDRENVSTSFVEPFFLYTSPNLITYEFTAESTYDWKESEWAVPFNITVKKLLKLGGNKGYVNVGGGVRYWLESSSYGAEGWSFRLDATFLFPRK